MLSPAELVKAGSISAAGGKVGFSDSWTVVSVNVVVSVFELRVPDLSLSVEYSEFSVFWTTFLAILRSAGADGRAPG